MLSGNLDIVAWLLLILLASGSLYAISRIRRSFREELRKQERLISSYTFEVELADSERRILKVSSDELENVVEHTLDELSSKYGFPIRMTVETEGISILEAGSVVSEDVELVPQIELFNGGKIQTTVWSNVDLEQYEELLVLLQTISSAVQVNAKNYLDVSTDHLTSLYNPLAIKNKIRLEVSRAKRSGQPVSLLFFDLDKFKRVNDDYGHMAGDMVLAQFGRILSTHTRETDTVGRRGGDEFAAILPDTDGNGAKRLAEQILKAINEFDFEIEDLNYQPQKISIKASIGVATFPTVAETEKELESAADWATYRAKSRGRNQVVVTRTPRTRTKKAKFKLAG